MPHVIKSWLAGVEEQSCGEGFQDTEEEACIRDLGELRTGVSIFETKRRGPVAVQARPSCISIPEQVWVLRVEYGGRQVKLEFETDFFWFPQLLQVPRPDCARRSTVVARPRSADLRFGALGSIQEEQRPDQVAKAGLLGLSLRGCGTRSDPELPTHQILSTSSVVEKEPN